MKHAWLERRTGWPGLVAAFLEERIPGGARWAYVFGSALVLLLSAQLLSGLGLALSYSPSVPAAWASVARLEQSGTGHLLRALHAHGATFLLVVASLHLLQTALSGAYRAPREVSWWLGLVLFGVLFAFCITGSLLPWDERGYWATRVTIGIAAQVSPGTARVLSAGADLGNLTLTRFYALHAMLLPLVLVALGTAHVAGVHRHGVTPPPGADLSKDEPFWPRQALYDAAFALLLLAGLLALALQSGAPLQAPADPAGAASPRPDWYFRPIFELLKHVPEKVATLLVPGAAALFLALLPVLDRKGTRRLPVLLALAGGFAGAVGLGALSYRADARSPVFQQAERDGEQRAARARSLAAARGVPPEGALAMLQDQPDERGKRLFARACAECHGEPAGPAVPAATAPHLGKGFLSRAWIRGALERPDDPAYWGHAKISGMESYAALGEEKLSRLTSFLYALRSHAAQDPRLDSERRLYLQAGCAECHALEEGKAAGAPSLAGYGSAKWLTGLLRDPGAAFYYDAQNRMPDFGTRLAPADLDDLAAFLSSLEGAP